MFSKQEASLLKQQFWTSFGQYLAPIPSAEGIKINWINYKTGVKDLHFKMDADNTRASIAIVLTHADTNRQAMIFTQLKQLQMVLQNVLEEEWEWELQVTGDYNKPVSRIYTSLTGVNIFRKEDWPRIISFFKPRIIALDAFWSEVKDGFVV